MIDVYILYNNNERSLSLLEDCKDSLSSLGGEDKFNLIPVLGYSGSDALELYNRYQYKIIPYYRNLLNADIPDTFRKELNGALYATAGHLKIWNDIANSNKPSIILEHDAVFKSIDFDLNLLEDFMIFWLGPRVEKIDDYKFPEEQISYNEVKRFEGVHAYAITPKTAEYLVSSWEEDGFTDSIDGALAMRNWYELTMVALDPPPLVAVVNRDGLNQSSIEATPALWNAENMSGFLSGLSSPPPQRKVIFENKTFINSFPSLAAIEPKILAISNDDGTSVKVIANNLLDHSEETSLDYICPEQKADTIAFKSYFSHYYYKIKSVGVTNHVYTTLNQEFISLIKRNDYKFIYLDCHHLDYYDTLYNTMRLLQITRKCMILFNEAHVKFLEVLIFLNYSVEITNNIAVITHQD